MLIIIVFVFIRWKKHKDEPKSSEIQSIPIQSEPIQPITPVESPKESIPQPIDPKDIPTITLPVEQTPEVQENQETTSAPQVTPPKPKEEDDDWYVRQ
jgi:hypothetical protein